jgi:hypothetical protein
MTIDRSLAKYAAIARVWLNLYSQNHGCHKVNLRRVISIGELSGLPLLLSNPQP